MVNSKQKGNAAEREVARMLRDYFPGSVINRRGTSEEAAGKALGEDLDLGDLPICIQVQHATNITPDKKLAEAEKAIGDDGRIPMAFIKKTGGKWFVAIRPEDIGSLMSYCDVTSAVIKAAGLTIPSGLDTVQESFNEALVQRIRADLSPFYIDGKVSINDKTGEIGVAVKLDAEKLDAINKRRADSPLEVRKVRPREVVTEDGDDPGELPN